MLALVTRMSSQNTGSIRLKAAGAYAEPGELRDILTELWKCSGPNRQELINKVFRSLATFQTIFANIRRKSISL